MRRETVGAAAGTVTSVTDTFFITGGPAADKLLHDDPLALMLGMLFDQRGAYPREGR